MKKCTVIVLVIVLAFALVACGRRSEEPVQTMPQATQAPTQPATLPTIDPTMGTNIPDPEVDTSMPDMIDPSQDTQNGAGDNGTENQGQTGNGQ